VTAQFDPMRVKAGEQVWWEDPADGLSSGIYTVTKVFGGDDGSTDEDSTALIHNDLGSEAEVFLHELRAPDTSYRRTTWADTRAWDAAMAASSIARGSHEHYYPPGTWVLDPSFSGDLPWHRDFDSHLTHDNPIVSIISNLLTLAHFDGKNVDDILSHARSSFDESMKQKGEWFNPTGGGKLDEGRTAWAHSTLLAWSRHMNGGDELNLMVKLARLAD